MEINNKEVGNRIKSIRLNRKEPTAKFALNFEPLASDSLVSRWERGVNLPNSKRLKTIAELGGITVEELLYGSNEEYTFKVLMADVKERGEFYKKFVETYSKYNKVNPGDLDQLFVEAFLLQNKKEIVEGTLKRLFMLEANASLNSKDESETKPKIQLTSDKIIKSARSYISSLYKVQDTFEEHYQQVKKAIDFLPYSATKLTREQLYKKFLKQGYEPNQAAAYAKDKYYISEASMLLHDFKDELAQLLNQYHNED